MLGSYSDSTLKKKFLKKEAIPSVFNVPTHSPSTKKEQTTHENPARKRLFASDNNFIAPSDSPSFFDSSEGIEVPSCKVFKPAMSPSTKIKKLQLLVKKKNKKIKQLQRKALRKEKTITGLITQLNKQKVLSKELGEKLDQNFGHLKLYKNELKNNGKKAGLGRILSAKKSLGKQVLFPPHGEDFSTSKINRLLCEKFKFTCCNFYKSAVL